MLLQYRERLESAKDGGKRDSKRHSGQPTCKNTQNLKKVIHARMYCGFSKELRKKELYSKFELFWESEKRMSTWGKMQVRYS